MLLVHILGLAALLVLFPGSARAGAVRFNFLHALLGHTLARPGCLDQGLKNSGLGQHKELVVRYLGRHRVSLPIDMEQLLFVFERVVARVA